MIFRLRYFIFFVSTFWLQGKAQQHTFVADGDLFGCRNFIENKGQYPDIKGEKVLFALDNGQEKIYFTGKGLHYELLKLKPLSQRERERAEHQGKVLPNHDRRYTVSMHWQNSQVSRVTAHDKQSYYFTFGGPEYNAGAFKKIIYHDVYPGIDIEYTIPANSINGIKYDVVLHPGANLSLLRFSYGGDAGRVQFQDDGSIRIKTPLEDIIEHAPASFSGSKTIPSSFFLDKQTIGFSLGGDQSITEKTIIDPWVTTTATLANNGYAFDVDYDFLGNTFIYGGTNPFKVACYNSSGVLQWVFGGTVTNPSWTSAPFNYSSNFGVNRFNSKTYIGQGYAGSGSQVIRLDASGNYDNFMNTANNQFQEVWDMGFHCTTAEVFVLGGGTTSNITAVSIHSVTATLTLTAFQPTVSAAGQDIVSHAIDEQGNIFVLGAGNISINNRLLRVNSTFNGNLWNQPSTYGSFSELGNKSGYFGTSISPSNGFNALAVNGGHLFYYDGLNLAAYDKTTGTLTSSTAVTGHILKRQGGIAVDDCNNIYLGGNGNIVTYSFTGTSFSSMAVIGLSVTTTNQYVYDIKLDKSTKTLYVSGSGFAGVYVPLPTLSCPTQSSQCLLSQGGLTVTSTSVTCAGPGSATVSAIGGTGPFSYTWIPSGQTGPSATGLMPGFHNVVVFDQGTNNTYTSGVNLLPVVPLSGTVPGTISTSCFGVPSATAAIQNFAGGSSSQSYSWTNGTSSQTAAIATGMGPGNYTVTVTDQLTFCQLTNTFVVVQPPTLSLSVSVNNPVACEGTSVTLTPLVSGGTPGYTLSWTNGPATGTYNLTDVAGNHTYTVTATDAGKCVGVSTIQVTFLNSPTLTVTNDSICPLETGVLSASGAQSYSWSNSTTGSSLILSPSITTVYTVTGTTGGCSSSAAAAIVVRALPVPSATNSGPACENGFVFLNAGGGSSFIWEGPQNFSSVNPQHLLNGVTVLQAGIYQVTVTAANSCTAQANTTIVVYQAPLVSAAGSTVCETGTINLLANSSASPPLFYWTGPLSFTATSQNPQLTSLVPGMTGDYSVTVKDTNNCQSSAVAHVSVTAEPSFTITDNGPLCEGANLSLLALTNESQAQCSWQGPGGFASSVFNPSIPAAGISANGVYSLTVNTGPCVQVFTRSVSVHPLPVITINGNNNVCEKHILNLTATANTTVTYWLWQANNFASSFPNIIRTPVSSPMAGNYTVSTSDLQGCKNSTVVTVNVYAAPLITVSDQTVCLNDPVIFSAAGGETYVWSGPDNFYSSIASPTLAAANNSGTAHYQVIGYSANSCTGSAVMKLNTRPLPVATLSTQPSSEICEGQILVLTGSGGIKYEWSGPGNILYRGKEVEIRLSSKAYTGNYKLTVFDSASCKSSTGTYITVLPVPYGHIQGTMGDCFPFCSDYLLHPSAGNEVTARWHVNKKYVGDNAFKYCFDQPGTFTVTGNFINTTTTCSNSAVFYVEAFPKPKADFTFTPEHPVENFDEVKFSAYSDANSNSYSWFYDHKKGTPARASTYSTIFETEGTYRIALLVENKQGCTDSIIKLVTVEPDFHIYIPDAFTPNDDRNNNVFIPVTRGVHRYHIQIFNRWGTLVFESHDPEEAWNGTYNNKSCKQDIYVYKLNAADKKGRTQLLKGHVTLYR